MVLSLLSDLLLFSFTIVFIFVLLLILIFKRWVYNCFLVFTVSIWYVLSTGDNNTSSYVFKEILLFFLCTYCGPVLMMTVICSILPLFSLSGLIFSVMFLSCFCVRFFGSNGLSVLLCCLFCYFLYFFILVIIISLLYSLDICFIVWFGILLFVLRFFIFLGRIGMNICCSILDNNISLYEICFTLLIIFDCFFLFVILNLSMVGRYIFMY